ncbi:ImmA/IrrE family metallo-endopeptidase [uncultured Parasphingorhabdus sp.]|uniref:ImmA/IrrE family metallo-endopeptidase n=1 Tax=uncultured Parasphingorhabdus sp. TaxID=2709694 RepID=UPI0030D7E9A6
MRDVPDNTGRFKSRPHYEPKELDRLFEKVLIDFFKESHGSIPIPVTTDDITLLIERDTSDFDPGSDLSEYGLNVEGVTEFPKNGKPRVRIASELAYDEVRENRYRTTLTHEYGHVCLHTYLFQMIDSEKDRKQVCKRDAIVGASAVDWIEWQAGYACGALLMPASKVRQRATNFMTNQNLDSDKPIRGLPALDLIELIKNDFQVSEAAARVRLSILGFLPN